ncbi:chromate efflux transporter [Cohnella sp. REN36]|uniref:chromate efflux transporter n=1 Tax=Cohnella sp. REN36 TaxID=2887347 RepID=UPI001D13F2D1|nr:chromate efflux transporter [Cohnella sp. REN36]MCC3373953.1 chromate efflux transporter [Cohnella sp. REN36]
MREKKCGGPAADARRPEGLTGIEAAGLDAESSTAEAGARSDRTKLAGSLRGDVAAEPDAPSRESRWRRVGETGLVALKLGLTSFGGPVAHLGYFREEYVRKRRWLTERAYADLVALCQFLPGPASSQVGIGVGLLRGGLWGGLAAWLGFTLPSVLALVAFAAFARGATLAETGWLHGLKLVAVAIVAQAVLDMGRKWASDRVLASVAVGAAALALLWRHPLSQIAAIVAAAGFGWLVYRRRDRLAEPQPDADIRAPIGRRLGAGFLLAFAGLLVLLPWLRLGGDRFVALFDSFYRSGALVFGGGHVVLPLLRGEVVPQGWVSDADFLAGYGVAQAVPGPLFTFASYVGFAADGPLGAAVATIAIFLPAFLLTAGALPFWQSLRSSPHLQGAFAGVNAAVVGLLLAALYDPIWTTTVRSAGDFAAALVLFALLVFWRLPPWAVVVAGVLLGWGMGYWG